MTKHITDAIDEFLGKLPPKVRVAASTATGAETKIEADWLLVTCIDCRYPHVVHEFMRKHHPMQLYDQLVLAGAALAATKSHTQRSNWAKTFLEHVGMSIELHNIRGVLILDHRTCGAYKEFGLLNSADDNSDREFEQHQIVGKEAAHLAIKEFRKRAKVGFVQVLLAPEVKKPDANDFPSRPTPLYAVAA
jgi:hypothetical protein